MEAEKGGYGLVWAVVGLMVVAGLAALALAPPGGGPGPPGGTGAPQAAFVPTNTTIDLGQAIEFNAAQSRDPDGQIVTFAWDFGDGQHGSGAVVEHTYTIVGAFEVELTVTDDRGNQDRAKSHAWVNDFVTFTPGFVNWTSGQPAAQRTVGTFEAYAGATAIRAVVNLSTVQPVGAKVNLSLVDPGGTEVAREARTITGNSFVTAVTLATPGPNATAAGTWSVVLQVLPAQPAVQPFVSVGYSGTVAVRYDPA